MFVHRPTRSIQRTCHAALLICLAAALLTSACTQAPSWQKLLTAKISEQYPSYTVQPLPDGSVVVRRPGQADVPVDVNAIAEFCRRGPKDCDYATDQMLLALRGSESR